MPQRRVAGSGIVAVSLLFATACGAGSGPDPQGGGSADPRELVAGLIAEPRSLDFTQDDGAAIPQALLVNVYEGLVAIDPDGEVVPALAEDWTVSDDRTEYTFALRDGVRFSNGEPFTADDAAFSIERVQDEWAPAVKSGMDVVESVEPVDAHTLRVVLSQPSNLWLLQMTTRIGAMFSRSGVDDLANEPIGTGPYVVEEWRRGDAIVFAANEDYWGDTPDLERVTFRYFDDPTAANNALLSGGIDVLTTQQAPETLTQFEDDEEFQIIEGTTNGEVVLSFNHDAEPLDDPRVRRAIKYGLDRQAIIDTAWAGKGELIGSMVPPTDPWYEDLNDLYPHDPEEAGRLLDEAGYGDDDDDDDGGGGGEPLSLRLRIPTLPYAVNSAQVVQSQLGDLGIRVRIDELEFPDRWLEEVFGNADYDMSIIAHVEPWDIVSWGNPDYYWRYDNEEVQRLLAEADAAPEDEHVEKLAEVGRILAEDAAADWLFLLPNLIVARAGVQGLPENVISESFDITALSVD